MIPAGHQFSMLGEMSKSRLSRFFHGHVPANTHGPDHSDVPKTSTVMSRTRIRAEEDRLDALPTTADRSCKVLSGSYADQPFYCFSRSRLLDNSISINKAKEIRARTSAIA